MRRALFIILIFSCLSVCLAGNIGGAVEAIFLKYQSNNTLNDFENAVDSILKLKEYGLEDQIAVLHSAISLLTKSNQYDKAMRFAHFGIGITKFPECDSAHASFLKQIGMIEYYSNNKMKAFESFNLASKFAKEKGILPIEATCYSNIGGILIDQNRINEAENYLKRAIDINTQIGESQVLSNLISKRLLATLYVRKGMHKEANVLFEHITQKVYQLNDTLLICSNLVFHAEQLMLLNSNEKAYLKTKEAMILAKSLKNKQDLYMTMSTHAKALTSLKKYEEASRIRNEMLSLQSEMFAKESQKQLIELETKYKVKNIEQEKVLLENENEFKRIEIERSNSEKSIQRLLFGGILLLITLVAFVYLIWKRNKDKVQQELYKRKELEAIVEAQELERNRVAKELHDGIVQDLTVMKLKVGSIINNTESSHSITDFENSISNAIREVREISYQMMPVVLRTSGLVDAFTELLERSFIPLEISYDFTHFDRKSRFEEKIEIAIYRIGQILINNIIRHSEATNVVIVLRSVPSHILFIVEDNGIGFDSDQIKKGIGLQSINSRVEMINGELNFDSSPGNGTNCQIRVPLK
jgi:signal transduction histidine kinase